MDNNFTVDSHEELV